MHPFLPVAALLSATLPAAAWTPCEDLWFSRNDVFDRAGYCFSSALGKALFDNRDCTGSEVTLGPREQAFVDFIRMRETELGCAVDTTRTSLDIPNLELRRSLETPVALSEFASACIGWQGAPFDLRAGPNGASAVISQAMPGDQIAWEYEAIDWPEGWSFVTLYRDETQVGLGWFEGELDHALCAATAG